jgi:hypothetical protein
MNRELTVREEALNTACRRRLADSPSTRWLWALASCLPLLGIVPLWIHARSRRTLLPGLYGLTALASSSFAVITLFGAISPPAGGLQSPQQTPTPRSSRGASLMLLLTAAAAFSGGHRLGQERAARQAEDWLRLDE